MSEIKPKRRLIQYDLLRILAAFSVVMLHCAAQHWYALDIYSKEWIIANSYDAIFRFGVPVFVMISGALFLNPEYELDIKKLYGHNILRFALIYVIWSCVYGLWDARTYEFAQIGWMPYLKQMLHGSYHLWFLPMLIGLYVLLPILRTWVQHAEKKNLQYFLGLFLVLQIGGETLRALTMTDEIHYILDLVKVEMICGYIGYFVWGYYLAHVGVSQHICKWIYIVFLPAILGNVILGNGLAHHYGKALGAIYDSFGIFTFCMATGLFLMTQDMFGKRDFSNRAKAVIKELSADTLGVYLVHVLLISVLEMEGIHSMLIPNIIGIPVYAFVCFGIGIIIAAVLRRIPVIGKYIC